MSGRRGEAAVAGVAAAPSWARTGGDGSGVGNSRELEGVVALEVPAGADGGEDLRLLDGVDAEVDLEVEVRVEELRGVARHLGHDRRDRVEDRVGGLRGEARPRVRRAQVRRAAAELRCGGTSGGAATPSRFPRTQAATWFSVGNSLKRTVSSRTRSHCGADGGEDLGLLDRVDAQVGLEVEVGPQEVGGVAGHLGDDLGDRREDGVVALAETGGAGVSTGDADAAEPTAVTPSRPPRDVVQRRGSPLARGVVALAHARDGGGPRPA